MNDSTNHKIEFKDAIRELEEINIWFQEENIDLDDGLQKFRRGMELIKSCKEKLDEVENEFEIIKKEFADAEETPQQIMQDEEELIPSTKPQEVNNDEIPW